MPSHTGLTLALGVTAAAVGGLLVSKKYITSVIQQCYPHQVVLEKPPRSHLVIQRLLDIDCGGNPLHIGIDNKGVQSISIRPGFVWHLLNFKQSSNSLLYEFEDGITLTVTRLESGELRYKLASRDRDVEKHLPLHYKRISAFSYELDEIDGLGASQQQMK